MATILYKNSQQETGSNASSSNNNTENEIAKISFLNFFRVERPKFPTKSICGFLLALFAVAIGSWILFSRHTSSQEANISLPGNTAAQMGVASPLSTTSSIGGNFAEIAEQISAQLDQAISNWEIDNAQFDEAMRDRLAIDLGNLERRVAPEKVEEPSTITASPIVVRPTINKEVVVTPTITAETKIITPTIKAQTVTITNTFTMPKVIVTPTITTSTVVKGPIAITHQCEFTPVIVHNRDITPTFTARPVKITAMITKKVVTVTPTVTANAIRVTPTVTQQPFVVTPTSYADLVTVTPTAKLPKLVVTSTEYNDDCYIDHVERSEEELEEERQSVLAKLRDQYKKDNPGRYYWWEDKNED